MRQQEISNPEKQIMSAASYNYLITDSSQMFVSLSSPSSSEESLQISSGALSLIKHKILAQTARPSNCNSYIDISSDSESSVPQAYVYEESYNQDSDEEYLPEMDSAQSEIVKKNKKHNLRSQEIKIITKEQYLKPTQAIYPEPIILDGLEPPTHPNKLEPFQADKLEPVRVNKLESVKVNFKQELRGPVTKKTKMEYLFRRKSLLPHKNKTHKITKALRRLRKQLA